MAANVITLHSLSNKENLGLKVEEYVTLVVDGVGLMSSGILL
jgi:hypothetical protein